MCWNRVSVKSSQTAAVVPSLVTICIIFSFLFHCINQSQWDITIITMETYSTRVSCSDAYFYAKWCICWNVSVLGKKQLLLLHPLVIQLRDLSLASVYTAFLIYTPVSLIHFSHGGYTMDVLGTLWLALSCSLYIWGLTDHIYAAKISWVQGQSHQKQYTDYSESKPFRLGSGTASGTSGYSELLYHQACQDRLLQAACCDRQVERH